MSPEQITGQMIDRRVDVYALGLLLYELLTNARAIAGDLEVQQIENARHGRIKPVEQLRPNVPANLRKILLGALHPQPEGRYQTAAALQVDLEAYIVNDRHAVGREDLVRLFRVVAAEASHLPPEFDSSPSPAAPDDNSAETMQSGTYQKPMPPQGSGDSRLSGTHSPHAPEFPESSAETMRSGSFVKAVSRGPGDQSYHPTDQVPLPESGAYTPPNPLAPIPLVSPVPPGVFVGGAAHQPSPPFQLTAEIAYPAHPASFPTAQATPFGLIPLPPTRPLPAPPPASEETIPAQFGEPGSPVVIPLLLALVVAICIGAYAFWPRGAAKLQVLVPPPPVVVNEPPKSQVLEPKIDPPVAREAPPVPEMVKPVPVVAKPPEPVRAAVVHVSTTPAMEVVVDKKSWGVSPIDVEVLGGKHTFVLQQLDLGLKRSTVISLNPGDKKDLGWVAKKGKIVVHVEPFGNIAVDGRVIRSGSSIGEVEVWEGRHSVIVSNDELKKTIVRPTDVKPDETAEVSVNLVSDVK